ncbi:MAG: phage holin family protein [Candidatus Latescibacterota bacterium]|nr:MAG: phage holin family protein [Candidatus Latescibacterota bacterium]
MQGFVIRTLITALGLWVAAALVPSMGFSSGWVLLLAALLLGAVNAIVRPVLIFLTLPITILSLGIFLLVINAAMLGLVAAMLGGFWLGGFFSAVFASIIVSIVSWFASTFIGPRGRIEVIYTRRPDR